MTKAIAHLRVRACEEQNGRCIYCGYPMLIGDCASYAFRYGITIRQARLLECTAEHLIARKDGGRTDRANIVAACRLCNFRRHARHVPRSPDQYLALVRRQLSKGKWHNVRILR